MYAIQSVIVWKSGCTQYKTRTHTHTKVKNKINTPGQQKGAFNDHTVLYDYIFLNQEKKAPLAH